MCCGQLCSSCGSASVYNEVNVALHVCRVQKAEADAAKAREEQDKARHESVTASVKAESLQKVDPPSVSTTRRLSTESHWLARQPKGLSSIVCQPTAVWLAGLPECTRLQLGCKRSTGGVRRLSRHKQCSKHILRERVS